MSENLCKRDPEVADANENTAVLMILEYLYIYIYNFFCCMRVQLKICFFLSWEQGPSPRVIEPICSTPSGRTLSIHVRFVPSKTNLYQKLLKSCCPQDGVLRDQAFARPVFFQCLKVS